ncbi:MAG: hypothetical protein K0Q82_3171 [Chryseobacterium indoltheticum]|jgi:hypothetical protein|nr:hypothetical protein [Chryseobacterium indoltheticum]
MTLTILISFIYLFIFDEKTLNKNEEKRFNGKKRPLKIMNLY